MPTPARSLALRLLRPALVAVVFAAVAWPAHAGDPGQEAALEAVAAVKRALASGTPEERRVAVNDVGRLSAHLDRRQQLGAAKILRKALEKTEDDAEIRRLMVRALARMSHEHAWIPVILAAQEDRDAIVRAQARQELLSGGADELTAFERILDNETSAPFRGELLLILRDRRKADAAPLLIAHLRDKSPIVRSAAAEALEAISGEGHGYDATAWQAWYERWAAARPQETGPSVTTGGVVEEPPPHITRSLRPDFYGLPLAAKDIVFVIDISGSVGSGGFGRAKRQITEAVALLGSDVHVAALFFSDKVHMWKGGAMVAASPANKEDLVLFLRGLEAGRSTDVYTPLNAGLTIVDKRVRAKQEAKEQFREAVAMITVSDGRDNMGALPPRVVADKLDRLDPALTVLHSIVLGEKESPLMRALAHRGGGHYLRAAP
ncbi:MAG: VWA domain-containing protein [Planctomycetota bacterium]|nr:VWA domain-containing protein [Planctomycetota bacterium]